MVTIIPNDFNLNCAGKYILYFDTFNFLFCTEHFFCVLQNNLDELFMLMHFLDAGKVSFNAAP